MFLRARSDGTSVWRRVVLATKGLQHAQASYSTRALSCASPAASARSRPQSSQTIRCPHAALLSQPQSRVLQTSSHTKSGYYPRTAALPLNWSSTAHRIRHIYPSAMTTQTQTRGHAGHSHHHHHDNTFLLSKNKNDAGVRITRIGLYVNLGMAVSKGFGGYVFNSQGKTFKPHMVSEGC